MYPWLTHIFATLSRRVSSGQLHHGLLIEGAGGLGKTELAKDLAGLLLCAQPGHGKPCGVCQSCKLFNAGSHPDLCEIVREKSQISVDQIREAIIQLNKTAQLSGNKVLIIYQADCLNQASANALLKTLEEPTANTYIMLLTDQPQRLLPTIRSRCEQVKLLPPSRADGQLWLQQQGLSGDLEQCLALSGGAPLKARDMLQQPDNLQYVDFESQLQALQQGQQLALQLATEWQEQAEQVVGWIQFWLVKRQRDWQGKVAEQGWLAHQQCQNVNRQLHQSGINRVMLLSGLLELVSHIPSE